MRKRVYVYYFDTNLLIHTGLFFLDLLLKLSQRGGVGGRSIGFEYLNVPAEY
jgi:hypothetical protein